LSKEEIDRSLKRMKTDHIDLLQLHYVNYVHEFKQIMGENGAYEAAIEAKQAGKIRHIGITGHRPELLAKWVQNEKFDQVLFHLNLAQPFALNELVPAMTELNMGKVAMKPLSGGFIQPVEKAIRYPYSQDVHVIISGMVSVSEVKQNIAAMEQEVGDIERLEMEQLALQLGEHNCRRCNYCECPIGINIPDIMISSKIRERLGLLPKGDGFYQKQKEKLFSCAEYEPCRITPLCEQKCPYHLPMQQVIQKSVSYFS
jgi:predicted aldo/keto reductase-like oxidoreductase